MTALRTIRNLFRAAPFGVLLLDEHGRILEAAGTFADASLVGHYFFEQVARPHGREAAVAVADAVTPGLGHTVELPLTPVGKTEPRWYSISTLPLPEPIEGARVALMAFDITEARAELQALRRARELFKEAEEAAHFGTWDWDLRNPEATWSEELYRIYGLDPATHRPSYQDYLTRVHPDDRERVRTATERALHHRERYSHDERVLRPDGEFRSLHTWALPVLDEKGELVRLVGVCQDVTDIRRAERERERLLEREQQARAVAEAAERRWMLLSRVSRFLVEASTDSEEVRHRALAECLAGFADWAVLVVTGEDELQVTVANGEGPREAWARAVFAQQPIRREAAFGPGKVLRTGLPDFLPQVGANPPEGDPLLTAAPAAGQPLTSYLCVPAVAHGEMLGALMVARVGQAPFTDADLDFAEEVAFRFAAALESARLLRQSTEALAARDEFISIASHELRTPQTTMKLQLDWLLRQLAAGKEIAPERLVRMATDGLRQVNRLTRLTEHLLDVSRLREGLTLAPEPGTLAQVVRRAVRLEADDARRAGSPLELDVAEDVTGQWDLMLMEQVVADLICNAITYGAGKPITIRVRATPRGGRIEVIDQGIGIDERDVERIFGPFERAVSPRHYGGLGLGLYLCRQIVEAHGGQISVESTPGLGSTFAVEVPRAPAATQPAHVSA